MANNGKNGKKTKSKTAVKKQNQFRTEYKDRISPIVLDTLEGNAGSVLNGPKDSLVMVPGALTKLFTQGTANGEIDGNQFNARFLNMKLKLNFGNLPAFVTSDGTANTPQQYSLYVRQCLVLEDLDEYLQADYTNPSSGRTQPAFTTAGDVPGYWDAVAKKFLFNGRVKSEFLSYEKRLDTKIRILSTRRILGDTTSRLQTAAADTGGISSSSVSISPDKHISFDWKMPKDKQTLCPALDGSSVVGYAPARMWVPCVMISLDRTVVDDNSRTNVLNIESISHFTYTDN